MCRKLFFFSLESFENGIPIHFGLVLNGNHKNQKAKPHKRSLVVGDQNGMRVLGLCRFVYEEFNYNNLMLVALYYGKIES